LRPHGLAHRRRHRRHLHRRGTDAAPVDEGTGPVGHGARATLRALAADLTDGYVTPAAARRDCGYKG
jgi:hypothetical protein